MSVESTFRRTVNGMLPLIGSAGGILLGLSGGADSVCLLHLLHKWCGEHGIPLAAAHLNHGIRGNDADRDEEFCRTLCERLSVPIHIKKADIPSLSASSGTGIEETARNVRYAFFDEIAGDSLIATAHNASDHVETVLFNLLRGCGTHGLGGIAPVRDGKIIRPLIEIPGEDIRQWCADNSIAYVTDATNADTDYTRNRIRHIIVPELRKITPSPEAALLRVSALARQDDDCLNGEARRLIASRSRIPLTELRQAHPAVLSRVLRMLYDAEHPGGSLTEGHIRSAMELVTSGKLLKSLDVPGGLVFRIDRTHAWFTRPAAPISAPDDFVFTYGGGDEFFEGNGVILHFSPEKSRVSQENHGIFTSILNKEENIYKLSIHKTLSFDKIIGALKIRYRRPGDTLVCGGMTHRVKKLFGDRKLSQEEKARLPILCDEHGIVWIPGFPLRDGLEWDGAAPALTITCLIQE